MSQLNLNQIFNETMAQLDKIGINLRSVPIALTETMPQKEVSGLGIEEIINPEPISTIRFIGGTEQVIPRLTTEGTLRYDIIVNLDYTRHPRRADADRIKVMGVLAHELAYIWLYESTSFGRVVKPLLKEALGLEKEL